MKCKYAVQFAELQDINSWMKMIEIAEGELVEEFNYPNQKFILKR